VQELPPNSVVLAQTAKCPVGMFKVGESMLGIQAHPEFSKAYDQALMELRVDRMGVETVQKGIRSLEKPIDDHLIAGWIKNFVEANQFP
jgi:GMP synthase-like glutamine amidotransferase